MITISVLRSKDNNTRAAGKPAVFQDLSARRFMKKFICLGWAGFLLLSSGTCYGSAAAVQKRGQMKNAAKQKQQMMMQKAILEKKLQMQQQAVQKVVVQNPPRVTVHLPPEQQVKLEMHLPPPRPEVVGDVVGLPEIMRALDQSSRPWSLIIDFEAKEAVVRQYMAKFRQQGITMNKPPAQYVGLIDEMFLSNPSMLGQPFAQLLQAVAVIEYDFDNGQNKDAMALKLLGSREAVMKNRVRLGMN